MHPRPRPQATKRKSATNRSTLEGKTAVGIVLSGVHDCKNAIIRHWRMTLYFETCIWTFFSVLSVLTLCHPLCTQLSSELYLCKLRFLAAFSHSSDLNSEMVWNRKEKRNFCHGPCSGSRGPLLYYSVPLSPPHVAPSVHSCSSISVCSCSFPGLFQELSASYDWFSVLLFCLDYIQLSPVVFIFCSSSWVFWLFFFCRKLLVAG